MRGLVGFGANLVMAHADSARARDALVSSISWSMPIYSCPPTAQLADLVLPVASAFETEGLRVGFEVSEAAQAHLQLRPRVVPPPGEARSDIEIVIDLANRLGLGDRFFGGEVEAGWRQAKLVKSLIAMAAGDDDTALDATTFLLRSRFGWSPERHDMGSPAAPTAATEAAEGELI